MKAITFYSSIIFSILAFTTCAKTYEVEQLSVQPFTDVVHRTGTLDFKRTQNVSFKSNGYLTQLGVDSGDYFVKGQLLASLDIEELNARKNASYAKLLQAKRDVVRVKKLLNQMLSSERELDIATTLVETTRAEYQVDHYNLDKATIVAPFEGVVLSRHSELGELQSPGQQAFKIAALEDNYVVKVSLTESEVGQVYLGQLVEVLFNKVGKIEGVVSKIPAMANIEGHLFEIEVSLPTLSIKNSLVAGQLAHVSIDFKSDNVVFKLPIKALMSVDKNGRALVLIQAPNKNAFEQKAFDIYKLENAFVYLRASKYDSPVNIVTQGWQNIAVDSK